MVVKKFVRCEMLLLLRIENVDMKNIKKKKRRNE